MSMRDDYATSAGTGVEDTLQRDATTLLAGCYEQMALIRAVEERLLHLAGEGAIRGTVHTCVGQEATAVGVVRALDPARDRVCSNHRGHGHYLAFTGDVDGLIAEILGHSSGVCGGVGGSQHVQCGGFYANGILGGMTPVAAGMALAAKAGKTGGISVMFLGDGSFGEGIVYETMNIASLWALPMLFAVEHNQYAQSTPTTLEHAGALARRGEPFGIPIDEVDGNDVLAVHAAASRAVSYIRSGEGPRVIFMHTYRLGPHSKGDDSRDPAEIELHRQHEPLVMARRHLDGKWCDDVERAARDRVSQTVALLRP